MSEPTARIQGLALQGRRHDLDWLRVIAFVVLIYFHAAIIFIPGGLPLIQNAETSPAMQVFVTFSAQFRLGLLFFISGVGVAFAKRRRNNRAFLRERSARLLVPLVVGIFVIVPPMVFTEKLFVGAFAGTFVEFYPQFFTNGVYPSGNLSWHHYWFIAYLYLFCLLGLPVFARLDTNAGLRAWINKRAEGLGLYLLVVPLIVVEILLRAVFPGFRDLIHDWASFCHWFVIFLAGYFMVCNPALLNVAERLRGRSALTALASTLLLFGLFYDGAGLRLDRQDDLVVLKYVVLCIVRMVMVWSCLLTCVGYAARYLQRQSVVIEYLNESVYPLFILHLTIMTAIGFFVVQWHVDLWLKYLVITTATFALVLVIFHCLIRPFDAMRFLFGVKPKQWKGD